MFRNGTVRDDIFHGSCPVLLGRKLSKFKKAFLLLRFMRMHYNLIRKHLGAIFIDCAIFTVLNQWADYHANFQTFKCSLNQFN